MRFFETSRKVQAFGSSLAVTIPSLYVKAHEVEKGSMVKVIYGLEGVLVLSKSDDDQDILGQLEKFIVGLEDDQREKMESEKRL